MCIFNRVKAFCLALFLGIWGCTFTLETRFQQDWSGKLRLFVSYSQMKAMMEAIDSGGGGTEEFLSPQEMSSLEADLGLIPGISKVKVINDLSESSVVISVRFADLSALNQVFENFLLKLVESGDNELVYSSEKSFFTLQGKNTLVYQQAASLDELSKSGFSAEMIMGFERKIRNVNHPSAVITNNKTQLTIRLELLKKAEKLIIKL